MGIGSSAEKLSVAPAVPGIVCVRDGGAFITSVPDAIPDTARGI
jgi:hypothetical protein